MAPPESLSSLITTFGSEPFFLGKTEMTKNLTIDEIISKTEGLLIDCTSKLLNTLFALNAGGTVLLVHSFKTFRGYEGFFIALMCFSLGLIAVLLATFHLRKSLEHILTSARNFTGDMEKYQKNFTAINKGYLKPYQVYVFVSLNLFILGNLVVLLAYAFRTFQ